MRRIVYSFFQVITFWLLRFFFRLRVEGSGNIPSGEGVIVASNHSSYLDILVIGCSMSRLPWFLGKDELFFEPFRTIFRNMTWIPVSRSRIDRNSLNNVAQKLEQGELIVIFPEGTRNNGRDFGRPKPGIGMILSRNAATVVPAYIEGTFKILPRGSAWPRFFSPVIITYGTPVSHDTILAGRNHGEDAGERRKKSEIYRDISEEVMEKIKKIQEKIQAETISGKKLDTSESLEGRAKGERRSNP